MLNLAVIGPIVLVVCVRGALAAVASVPGHCEVLAEPERVWICLLSKRERILYTQAHTLTHTHTHMPTHAHGRT